MSIKKTPYYCSRCGKEIDANQVYEYAIPYHVIMYDRGTPDGPVAHEIQHEVTH
jgi:hypothetical protein